MSDYQDLSDEANGTKPPKQRFWQRKMSPHSHDVLYVIQIFGNFVVLAIVVALLFTSASNFANLTSQQTEANRDLIRHLQQISIQHARASVRQNCAIASEIAFLVAASPKAPPSLLIKLRKFVRGACKIEVVPPLGSNGSPSGSTGGQTGNGPIQQPQPSGGPSSPAPPSSGSPSVKPSKSPSPTATCLPVIGCV